MLIDLTAVPPETRPDVVEQDRLRALEDLEVFDGGSEQRFEGVTRLAQRLFGVPIAMLSLVGRDEVRFRARQGIDLESASRTESFCSTAIASPDTFVVEDLSRDERFHANRLVTESGLRFYAAQPLIVPGGHAVGTLCLLDEQPRTLSEADQQVLRELGHYLERELTLREEFRQAARMQRSLLPRRVPVVPDYELAGACVTAAAAGGDLYDWHVLPDSTGFTVADVMGKGMAASIMAAAVRAVVRAGVRERSAADVVAQVQDVLSEDLGETGTFVTLLHGRLDLPTGVVRYVDAGHGLSLHVRADGSAVRLAGHGLPLGISSDELWSEQRVRLEPGDVLLVFSDGLLDLMGESPVSLENLASLVRVSHSATDLVHRVTALARRERLVDDVTVVAVRRCPA